jgi:oligopeptide transport system substrate-binding protein
MFFLTSLLLIACDQQPWNNPYPRDEAKANIFYTSFLASPKTLDPARSFSTDEAIFTAQIYEPPLQYAYLIRPYTLTLLTAAKKPTETYFNSEGQKLPNNVPSDDIAFTRYDIEIKPGIYYQPHPAFAKDVNGNYLYHHLRSKDLSKYHQISDFPQVASRELVADDYVYQIKRLAEPGVNSPIYGLMSTKIVGLSEFLNLLNKQAPRYGQWLDLRKYPLAGAKAVDAYHYYILIKGRYPQFLYWLAMSFFAPVPWEADKFYAQPGMIQRNMTLDWYPIGTGPYRLIENNPNRRMVLQKNPLFRPECFPTKGMPGDVAAGFLKNAGKRLPFIDKIVFTLEKETLPRWIKFLQGYYDQSGVSSDSFDQAIQINSQGQPYLTPEMKQKGIYLQTSIMPAISYIGFNMLDEVVGGNSERARKLRLAISIAINYQEYINIFLNGRGVPAQGPLPPGIFGFLEGKQGINPYVFNWKGNRPVRKSLKFARRLMAQAGYPNGIDRKTDQPLILNYDFFSTGGPDEKSLLAWLRKQFAKIGIQLNVRSIEYNRFQEEVRQGQAQIFSWAWIADYPDPENFLSLLYGPNGKVEFGGENATNYENPTFDALFDQMKNMPNGHGRQQIIDKMLEIIRHDAPWVWGYYQKEFVLSHVWVYPLKPSAMSYNIIKYQRIKPLLRNQLRKSWNQRILWPLFLVILIMLLLSLPVLVRYRQKEKKSIK